MHESISNKVVRGTIWSAFDRFGVMAIQFVVNLVLARLLTPDEFGAVGMLYIFIAVSQTFVDGGFGSALIQKKKPSNTDYSTIFFWNIIVGCVLYCILFCCAGPIARFYKMPILVKVLRIISISIIFNGIAGLLMNRLQKQLQFNTIAISNIIGFILAAAIAIAMAISGAGIWSLVAMSICQPLFRSLIMVVKTRWIPKLIFSIQSLKELFAFGGFLLLGNLLENIFKNLQGLIIGKRFSAEQMGYYSQADKLDQVVSYSVPQVIAAVMYPVFSQYQDDSIRLRNLIKVDLHIISYLIYPLLILLILIAEPLIVMLYGDKWTDSVPYFQILCCGGFFYSLNNIPYYTVAACGKSKALLMASFYKWSFLALSLFIGMNFGMIGIMWGIVVSYVNIYITNCLLAKKYIKARISEFFQPLLPSIMNAAFTGILSYLILAGLNLPWGLSIPIYIGIYLAIGKLLRIKAQSEAFQLLKKVIRK